MTGKHYKLIKASQRKKRKIEAPPQAPPPLPLQREITAVNGSFLPEIL